MAGEFMRIAWPNIRETLATTLSVASLIAVGSMLLFVYDETVSFSVTAVLIQRF
jgi:preprotein translocase subunit SecE